MDLISIFLGLSVIVAFLTWIHRHDPRLPPCPGSRVPIFGHLLQIGSDPRATFEKWRNQCGDIYSVYMGQSLTVVLNGYDLLKEALVTQGDVFSERPYVLFDTANSGKPGLGLSFSKGELWKEQKTITMKTFRQLGDHTRTMSERVSEIAAINNDLVGQQNGQPIDLEHILTPNITNVICSIVFGRHFAYNEAEFVKAIRCMKEIIVDGDGRNLANYFPCLSIIPGDLFKLNKLKKRGSYLIENFLQENIKTCISQDTAEHNIDNYITMYVAERDKKLKAGQYTALTHESLTMTTYHLFSAGLESTSTTLKWCILYFLHYPETQEQVYREIEKEVGLHRPPNMSDKDQLHYLNAFIKETQRIASILPLNVARLCCKTISLRGYTIPKGTQIIPCLDSVFYDKKIWGEDVHNFRPERFLDNNGKVKHPEEFVPFSMGKRMCPGVTLANMELFLFLSSMVQRFKFVPSEPGKLPSLAPVFGLTACPASFQVRALDRNL